MKILSFLFPGFTALDLIGPTTIWGLMPGAEFQTVARAHGPVKVDMGLEIVATHSFDNCWSAPDVLFVPGGGHGVYDALQDDELLDAIARVGSKAKWVTSVCTGALLLGAAGLTKGYRSACYWYARPDVACSARSRTMLASSSIAIVRVAAVSLPASTSRSRWSANGMV